MFIYLASVLCHAAFHVVEWFQSAEYLGCYLISNFSENSGNAHNSLHIVYHPAVWCENNNQIRQLWLKSTSLLSVLRILMLVFCVFFYHRPEAYREPHQTTTDQTRLSPVIHILPLPLPCIHQHSVIVSISSKLLCWSDNLTPLGLDRRPRGSHHWSSKLCLAMPQVRSTREGGETRVVLYIIFISFYCIFF